METISPDVYEKLGQFYLGREYDLEARSMGDRVVMLDSKDLVTHGVVLGMTGSGKTGLCMTILEEAAMDQVPAIIIDPKGDIANLLLGFPDLDGKSFLPWVHEEEAVQQGLGVEEYAENVAGRWRQGLADWGMDGARIRKMQELVDINVFTPGSKAGIPVSILGALSVPSVGVLEDAERLTEQVLNTVTSLLSLVGIEDGEVQSAESVLVSMIVQKAWLAGRDVCLEYLVQAIQKPDFDKVGVLDLNLFMPVKARQALALKFNTLLASPTFASWMEGEGLEMDRLMRDGAGRPRVSIFSIAHLGDRERMFFVSLLMNQMVAWMRSQKGTSSLRALFYMDEICGYLPPSANPPSKRPLMTMLKQGRAFGLGCLLATQNPVDLDYKGLSNIGTWMLGRLQTERDKMRVLDGLEGAAVAQNAKFDRSGMERALSALGNRVFLMNNVHEDGPVVFQVRWTMSYLPGPLTREQIKGLMESKRGGFGKNAGLGESASVVNPMAMPKRGVAAGGVRPAVGMGVREWFMNGLGGGVYQPYLLRKGEVRFVIPKTKEEVVKSVCLANAFLPNGIDWERGVDLPKPMDEAVDAPADGVGFGDLPGYAMNAENYKQVEKDFEDWMYRNERYEVMSIPAMKSVAQAGESESDFRARVSQEAREQRDGEMEELRGSVAKKLAVIEQRKAVAMARMEQEKAQSTAAVVQAGMSVLTGVLGGLFGRKTSVLSKSNQMLNKASSAWKNHQDVAIAESKVENFEQQMADLQREAERSLAAIAEKYQAEAFAVTKEWVKPTKANVSVESVGLLWVEQE